MIPRRDGIVVQNRWREAATDLGDSWRPSKTVSIVVPAYNNAAGLNLLLASLAAQDYPSELMEVIVVDDGSQPALSLAEIRPARTRLLRAENGWGRANAVHEGITHSDGEILLQLDSDLIVDRHHVTSHLRIHDQFAWAAAKGDILFVDSWPEDPRLIMEAVRDDQLANVFHESTKETQWVENVYAKTDDLNNGGDRVFSILTGATCSMPRSLYELAGGMRTDLRLGEDTDLAYRIAQRGAVFVPCRDAQSFHLGLSNVHVRSDDIKAYNRPFYAQAMPLISETRSSTGRQWAVPMVRAVVETDVESAYLVRACVDRILSSVAEDVAVDIIGPWHLLADDRRNVLTDPLRELHAVKEWYGSEGRVRLLAQRPVSAFPSPFEVDIPVGVGVNRKTVHALLRLMRKQNLGIVALDTEVAGVPMSITMWRTAAVERARFYWPDESTRAGVAKIWGQVNVDATKYKVHDLFDPTIRNARINWHRDNSEIRRLKTEIVRLKSAAKPNLIGRIARRIKGSSSH